MLYWIKASLLLYGHVNETKEVVLLDEAVDI